MNFPLSKQIVWSAGNVCMGMGMLAGAPGDSRFKSLSIDCVVSKQIVWSAANVCMGMGRLASAPVDVCF